MTWSADKWKSGLIQVATHMSVLAVWELLSRFVIPPQFLPPPSAIAVAFVTTIESRLQLPAASLTRKTILVPAGFGPTLKLAATV